MIRSRCETEATLHQHMARTIIGHRFFRDDRATDQRRRIGPDLCLCGGREVRQHPVVHTPQAHAPACRHTALGRFGRHADVFGDTRLDSPERDWLEQSVRAGVS